MTSNPFSEPGSIATCLERGFEILGQIACSVQRLDTPSQTSSVHRLARGTHHSTAELPLSVPEKVSKLLPLFLQAMETLNWAADVQNMEGCVIYKYVKVYEGVLLHICKLSKSCETNPQSQIPNRRGQKRVRGNQGQDSTEPPQRQSRTILDLCDLAVAMISSLDNSKRARELMREGCLSVLMDMIGSGLKASVFRAPSSDTIDDQSQKYQHHQAERPHRTLEAKDLYLIYILKQVPTLMDDVSSQHAGTPLLTLSKKKLQNALLNSVFSNTALGMLAPSLEKPERPTEPPPPMDLKEVEAQDWYKNEVWKLVGWDVLDDYLRQPLQGPKPSTSS